MNGLFKHIENNTVHVEDVDIVVKDVKTMAEIHAPRSLAYRIGVPIPPIWSPFNPDLRHHGTR
jgi:hypothetical protein